MATEPRPGSERSWLRSHQETSTASSSRTEARRRTRTPSRSRAGTPAARKFWPAISYHGATAGAITLTSDPRRWAAEPDTPGVVHVPDPYHRIQRGWDSTDDSLARLEEIIELKGPGTIMAGTSRPV